MTNDTSETTLVRRTLRTVALLVGACVLFVGALSVVAVALTSRAVGARGDGTSATTEASPSDRTAKKPLAI